MPKAINYLEGITGVGARFLENIPVTTLMDGDIAFVLDSSNRSSIYEFQASATDADQRTTHPYKIRPLDYSVAGVWYEQLPYSILHGGITEDKVVGEETWHIVDGNIMSITRRT